MKTKEQLARNIVESDPDLRSVYRIVLGMEGGTNNPRPALEYMRHALDEGDFTQGQNRALAYLISREALQPLIRRAALVEYRKHLKVKRQRSAALARVAAGADYNQEARALSAEIDADYDRKVRALNAQIDARYPRR